jgi:hypothetical protein
MICSFGVTRFSVVHSFIFLLKNAIVPNLLHLPQVAVRCSVS